MISNLRIKKTIGEINRLFDNEKYEEAFIGLLNEFETESIPATTQKRILALTKKIAIKVEKVYGENIMERIFQQYERLSQRELLNEIYNHKTSKVNLTAASVFIHKYSLIFDKEEKVFFDKIFTSTISNSKKIALLQILDRESINFDFNFINHDTYLSCTVNPTTAILYSQDHELLSHVTDVVEVYPFAFEDQRVFSLDLINGIWERNFLEEIKYPKDEFVKCFFEFVNYYFNQCIEIKFLDDEKMKFFCSIMDKLR